MELPYPPQEFVRRPTSPEEALQMELRTYGESPGSLRLDALSLEGLYGKTALATHLKRVSRYMSALRVDTGASPVADDSNLFYIGSLMMMHAHGQTLGREMRKAMFAASGDDTGIKARCSDDIEYRKLLAEKYRADFYYVKSRLYQIPETDPELYEIIDVISGQLTHGSSNPTDPIICAEGMMYSHDMIEKATISLWSRFTRS